MSPTITRDQVVTVMDSVQKVRELLRGMHEDVNRLAALAYTTCPCGFKGTKHDYDQHDCVAATARAASREECIGWAVGYVTELQRHAVTKVESDNLQRVIDALEEK